MTEQHDDRANGTGGTSKPHRPLQRPPAMGELKREADAQALTLRAELRARMRVDGLTAEEAARQARLDAAALTAFLAGASLNPRWQERLARWLDRPDTPD